MDISLVEKIADAVLYEGYMLYPYRASSVKNRQRFNWGALAPKSYSDSTKGTEACEMQTECLVTGDEESRLNVKLRFLHLRNREIGKFETPSTDVSDDFQLIESIEVGGELYPSWQEAIERDFVLPPISLVDNQSLDFEFSFPEKGQTESLTDDEGKVAGVVVRSQAAIRGKVNVRVTEIPVADLKSEISNLKFDNDDSKAKLTNEVPNSGGAIPKLFRVTINIRNTTDFDTADGKSRGDALLSSIVSTHTILKIDGGEFISSIDPPNEYAAAAAKCENKGTYPVLAGIEGDKSCILSSPIILYDYPEIAPESPGDLFDGTEIDEILTLRIMTMTDDEKREMRSVDERARKLLERTENMPDDQLLKMHGVLRGLEKSKKASYG